MSENRRHDVQLQIDETGRGRILLAGRDVSALVRGIHIDAGAGLVTTVELELAVVVAAELSGARVLAGLDAETEELLAELGWTPPAGDR